MKMLLNITVQEKCLAGKLGSFMVSTLLLAKNNRQLLHNCEKGVIKSNHNEPDLADREVF